MSAKSKQNVASSVGIVFVLSLGTSLLSFVCEMFFAMYFGVSAETDAFAIASQIPAILFAVVPAAISTTVVPLYSKMFHNDDLEGSQKFISRFTTMIAVFTVACVVICEIIAPVIVKLFSPGIDDKTFAYAVKFIRITFPTIIFTSIMGIFMGVLQVHKKFGRSSFLEIIRQCVYAILIIVLHGYFGIYAAVFGLLIASIIEFLFSYCFVASKVKLKPDFNVKDQNVINAIKMSVPIFAGIGTAEINRLVNKIAASFLDSGSISTLNYASRLSGAFTSLVVASISTVMFPYFAEKASKNDREGLSKMFFLTLNAYLILTIPIIAGGVILRQELVEAAFLRGAFTKENAYVVAGLFAGYLLSMIFSALKQTGAKLFYAQGNTKTPMVNTIIGVCLNIVLNIILGYFMGAMGLVYATVISTAIISVLLLISARKYIDIGMWKGFSVVALKTLGASAAMAGVLMLLMPIVSDFNGIVSVVLLVGAGAIAYGVLLLLLAKKEIKEIVSIIKNK